MMDTGVAIFPFMLLVLLAFGAILIAVVALVAGRNRSPSGPPLPSAIPSAPVNREARVAILRQLAERQITVDEAEARLAAMGNPVPVVIASAPPAPSSTRGCLVAVLVVVGLLSVITIAGVLVSLLTYRSASSSEYRMQVQDVVTHAEQEFEMNMDETSQPEAEVTEETIETWEEETE